jgi:raffinose/stachyose/melibiose transport system permease protein
VHWVGLTNWLHLFDTPASQSALFRTLTAAGMSWGVQILLGAAIGIYVAGRHRYRGYLAVVFFVPMVLSSTAIGIVWANLMDPNFGALSPLLHNLGIRSALNLLGSPRLALYAVTAVVCWQFIPFNTLLFMGGRRQIPEVLYEAARLDGASPLRCLRSITLPQLRYTFVTASVLILVGSLGYFDLFLVMTDGGPGDATQVLAMRMYDEGFSAAQFGAGSTIAVALAVLGLAIGVALVRLTGFGRMRSQREGL